MLQGLKKRIKILPEEEVRKLYLTASNGDRAAFDMLFDSVIALILKYAGFYANAKFTIDELISEGCAGFVGGVLNKRWDPERSKWSTYISNYILGAMKRRVLYGRGLIRIPESNQDKRRKSGETCEIPCAPLLDDCDKEWESSTPEGKLETEEEISRMLGHMNRIDQKERDVLVMRFIEGKTLRSIAEEIGLSKEGVRVIQKRGVRNLKTRMGVA